MNAIQNYEMRYRNYISEQEFVTYQSYDNLINTIGLTERFKAAKY